MIAAGKLDRRMEILTGSNVTSPLGAGAAPKTYAHEADTYAEQLELRTVDAARAGGRDTYNLAKFRIRYRADLTTDHRVRVETVLYDILAIDKPDRRTSMILTVEEVTR